MTLLFKKVTIVEPVSTTLPPPVDLLIQEGRITKIGNEIIFPEAEIIEYDEMPAASEYVLKPTIEDELILTNLLPSP